MTLCENTEYCLSALPSSLTSSSSLDSFSGDNPDQSLFLVKLTEQSEKALDKFLANQNKISRRPMIHFESGTNGSISVPAEGQDSKEDDDEVFYFSIAPETSGCLDINVETSNNKLAPLGSTKQKLTIHATNETFSQTRKKMAMIEDANKQQQAKEIRPGLKGKRGKQAVESRPTSAKPAPKTPLTPTVGKALPPPLARANPTSKLKGVQTKAKPENAIQRKQPTPPPTSRSQDSSPSLNSVSARPIRERVVHLLALRTYKKPELVLRLRSDGFKSTKDQESLYFSN